ncbi:MAG: hypothetical protein M0Z67_03635 [Nitrospiraceae bacterium]|nr:hypothetical protein [Nitrospiraceae bacterium]
MSISRRNLFKAAVAGAALSGMSKLGLGKRISSSGTAEAVMFGDPTFDDVYKQIGKYIHLVPGKYAGGVGAYDMSTGNCLAWLNMSIWAGNKTPIVHHIAAFASPDPYKEFEYVVDSQGGKNLYIYGVTTPVKDPAPGFNIWRINYDGTKMNILEDVAETTGVGLGVHVTIAPDNERFSVADGQKDIFAVFKKGRGTQPSSVEAVIKFDWEYNNSELARAWVDGGTLTIKKLKPPYHLKGTNGIKVDWELVPGGELFAEQGKVPGPHLKNLCALDSLTWEPQHKKYAVAALRLIGCGVVFDTKTWEPKAICVGSEKHAAQGFQVPFKKVGDGEWTATFKNIPTPAHQAGFNPTGDRFLLMNNARENVMAVFDSSNYSDPTKWRRVAGVGDPSWRGAYPNPFHMCFTPDGKKLYVTLWWPSPSMNGICAVDTRTWKITKVINIGPDTHTIACTDDGKWLFGVYSGYQKTKSGTYVVRVKDDKLYGLLPSPFGHHDSCIVPRSVKGLAISRCTTT